MELVNLKGSDETKKPLLLIYWRLNAFILLIVVVFLH